MKISYIKSQIARNLDALYRGLSRGLAARTTIQIVGQIFRFNTDIAADVVVIPVSLITAGTSYVGTRWWGLNTENPQAIRSLTSSNRSCFFRAARMIDAFFRGNARAESVATCFLIISQLTDSDWLRFAGGTAGLATLFLATWTSYDRTGSRVRYAGAVLLPTTGDSSINTPLLSHVTIPIGSANSGDAAVIIHDESSTAHSSRSGSTTN